MTKRERRALRQFRAERGEAEYRAFLDRYDPLRPSGRPQRPGLWSLWVIVRAAMEVRGVGAATACRRLSMMPRPHAPGLPPRFSDRPYTIRKGKVVHRWNPRSAATLARDFRRAEQRRKTDREFRAETDFWLPMFVEAEQRNVSPTETEAYRQAFQHFQQG